MNAKSAAPLNLMARLSNMNSNISDPSSLSSACTGGPMRLQPRDLQAVQWRLRRADPPATLLSSAPSLIGLQCNISTLPSASVTLTQLNPFPACPKKSEKRHHKKKSHFQLFFKASLHSANLLTPQAATHLLIGCAVQPGPSELRH